MSVSVYEKFASARLFIKKSGIRQSHKLDLVNTVQLRYNADGGVQGSRPHYEWYRVIYCGTGKRVPHPLVKINLLHTKSQQCLSIPDNKGVQFLSSLMYYRNIKQILENIKLFHFYPLQVKASATLLNLLSVLQHGVQKLLLGKLSHFPWFMGNGHTAVFKNKSTLEYGKWLARWEIFPREQILFFRSSFCVNWGVQLLISFLAKGVSPLPLTSFVHLLCRIIADCLVAVSFFW